MPIVFRADLAPSELDSHQVQSLFESVKWPHAQVPQRLMSALSRSEILITAWDGERLIGLANVVGDGEFYAYIHWLITHADYQRSGLGRTMLAKLLAKLESRNHVFVFSDLAYYSFWQKMGFVILSADPNDEPHGPSLIAGYRWHPIPGVRYDVEEETAS